MRSLILNSVTFNGKMTNSIEAETRRVSIEFIDLIRLNCTANNSTILEIANFLIYLVYCVFPVCGLGL